jgi:hypothetical protein
MIFAPVLSAGRTAYRRQVVLAEFILTI